MLVTLLGIVTLVRLVQLTERIVPDAGDAVGDRVASALPPGYWNEGGLAPDEQVPPSTLTISGIGGIHRDRRQAGAARERQCPRCW